MKLNRISAAKLLISIQKQILEKWSIAAGSALTPQTPPDEQKTLLNRMPLFLEMLHQFLNSQKSLLNSSDELQLMSIAQGLEKTLTGSTELRAVLKEIHILQNLILKSLDDGEVRILENDCRILVLDFFQSVTQIAAATLHLKDKQREITQERDFLNVVLENLVDGIVACDAQGEITVFNSAGRKFHGLTQGTLSQGDLEHSYPVFDSLSREKLSLHQIPLYRALEGERIRDVELSILEPSGRIHFYLTNGQALKDNEDNILGAVVTMRDITALRESQSAQAAQHGAFINYSQGFVGMFDLDLHPVFINPQGLDLIAIDRDTHIENLSILDFFAPPERTRIEKTVFPKLFKNGHWEGEVCLQNLKTGIEIPIFWSLFPILNPEMDMATGYGWNSRLLVEEKRLEAEQMHERLQMDLERNRLSRLFDQAPLPIFMTQGPEHTYVLANPSFMKSFASDRQVIGKSLRQAWPELSEKSFFMQRMNRVLQTGKTQTALEIPLLLHQDSGKLQQGFFNFIYQPIRNGHQENVGVLVLAMDVTTQVLARQSLLESEERFRLLANSMPQMVWTSRADGSVDYCSRGWTDFTGRTESDLLGQAWMKSVHPDDLDYVIQTWTRARESKEIFSCEYRLQGQTAIYHWFLARAVPVFNEQREIAKWYGTCTDIHQQKQLAEDLQQAKTQAENANLTKSAFLANMSHEIRTPLSAILGFTELLKSPDISSKEQQEFVQIISRNGQALTHLIDDILDLSKVEAGRIEIEKVAFSISDLTHEIFDLFREKVRSKGLQLTAEIKPNVPERLLSDPTRIRQILINIIGNAVKFTSAGLIHMKVESTFLKADNYLIEISVSDTGPGLTSEQKARLFQAFSQGDNSANRKFGGTGLGLALSRRLARAMGGDINLESCEVGKGCTFAINFQAQEIAKIEVPEIKPELEFSQEFSGLSDVRILVVDDLIDNQMLVRKVLTRNGAIVEVASNGEEGIKKAMESNYDVILMDLQMPLMDGYEAVRLLRSRGYLKPILALTAHAMDQERQKTLDAGYDGHLTKPLNTKELLKTLNQFSRHH